MYFMIDNYDSFTFNLVQYFGQLGVTMEVFRNDKIRTADIAKKSPRAIVISPGPCTPEKAGISVETIQTFAGHIPILGVCLGHQAIGCAYGGKIIRGRQIVHGKISNIRHFNKGVFQSLRSPLTGGRYHSLVIERESLPDCLEITAESEEDNEIMGVQHKILPVQGIQFHPESVLTPAGKRVLKNFIKIVDTFTQNNHQEESYEGLSK